MIKVGIECESIEDYTTWGVGRQTKKILEELAKRPELESEFKFFLYFKSKIPDYSFLNNPLFIKKIIKIPILPASFSLYYYVLLPIKLYFEHLNVMFFPNYMFPLIFRGQSIVVLTEDVYRESIYKDLPWRYRLAYTVFAGWAARRATKIITFSESSKKALTKLWEIEPERIIVNPHGVDVQPKKNLIENWKLKIKNYILYVGQAFPRRHLREIMLAFEKIAPQFPNLELVAIGKDKYIPSIIERLKKDINVRLGREAIIYYDYVPDNELIRRYSKAESIIYVSETEAFGLPPLEALGYGTVPVVADSEVTREIFGNNAFFVNRPISIESIAQALQQSLTDREKRKTILASAESILNKYKWSDHTNRFLKITEDFSHV